MGQFDNSPDFQQNKKDAEALCMALGEGEVGNVAPAWFEIKLGENRLGLHINAQDRKQWQVSGEWPWDKRNRQQMPPSDRRIVINVTKSRGVEALAKDIQRKLLDIYKQQHAEMLVQAEAASKEADRRIEIINELCELTGARATERTLAEGNINPPSRLNIHELHVAEYGKVKIKTYELHPDVAKLVIEALKKGAEAHPG